MNKITMNLSDKDVQNTETLKQRLHARSKAETVSTALSVTTSLSKILEEGGELLVKGKDGTTERIIITGLN